MRPCAGDSVDWKGIVLLVDASTAGSLCRIKFNNKLHMHHACPVLILRPCRGEEERCEARDQPELDS
jgi:hypothetical protein